MKHKKLYLTISFLISILSLSFCSSAAAWANGSYITILETENQYNMCVYYAMEVPPYEDPIECYQRFFLARDSAFYSSHDYIAHFALDYLCASDPSGKYNWLKDPNQRYFYIYLLGTEYPDYSNPRHRPTMSLRNIQDVSTYVRYSHSNLLALRATREMAEKAVKYLNKPYHWREEPALFLGTVTHFIADLSFPPHILRPYMTDFSKWLNTKVSEKTILDDYHQNTNDRFFTINLEEIIGYTPDKLNILELFAFLPDDSYLDVIYFIAEMMMFTTLLDLEVKFNLEVGDGTWNVTKFMEFFNEKGKFDFDSVGRYNEQYVGFFNRVEELLNWAIYWTVAALKLCLDQWDGEPPHDDNLPKPQPDDPDREPPFDTADFLVRYGAMIVALTALGLVGRKFLGRFG